jgi:hypothetical protein
LVEIDTYNLTDEIRAPAAGVLSKGIGEGWRICRTWQCGGDRSADSAKCQAHTGGFRAAATCNSLHSVSGKSAVARHWTIRTLAPVSGRRDDSNRLCGYLVAHPVLFWSF